MNESKKVRKPYHVTAVENPILADGIHLTPLDKAVYGILAVYEDPHGTSSISRHLLSLHVGGDTDAIEESMQWLEYLALLHMEVSSEDRYQYELLALPADIVEAAALCRDATKLAEVVERKIEVENKRKKVGARVAPSPVSKGAPLSIAALEERVAMKEISVKLGKDYLVGDPELDILAKGDAFSFIQGVRSGEIEVGAKTKESYLKAYFAYVKQFKAVPSEEVMGVLETCLQQHTPKTVASAIKRAKKDGISITSSDFGKTMAQSVQKTAENTMFWKQQHGPAKKDVLQRGLKNTASNYQEDEDEALYRRMLSNP